MKFSLSIPIIFLLFFPASPASAHFFPNISSIPPSSIPNTTVWDAFNQLLGCHHGQKKVDGLTKLKKYLQYFGYLNSSYTNLDDDDFDDYLESAIKTYQLNFNLEPTGELDEKTLNHIVKPRCGNADIVNGSSTMNSGKQPRSYSSNSTIHTVAHYSFFPGRPRWTSSKLTYAFLPENQLPEDVKALFSRAFERWSEVTPLTFTETTSVSQADLRIGFFSGDHGDGEPFDGVLGTLAHAFSPPVGRFHLDGDENWVTDGNFINGSPMSAVDLESVAVHEIGHLLGLGHSSVEDAIMYPSISSGVRKVELANDDIMGIQELYGSNPSYVGSEPSLTPTPRQDRDTSGAHYLRRNSFWEHSMLLVIGIFLFFLL